METTTDNMTLWRAVEETPPAMTKRVNQRGGFTAVCAQYQIMQATEQWGPYGKNWGVRGLEYDLIRDGKGEPVMMLLKAEFYYPGGAFELGTDISFRVGDDLRKKLLTDLTTKALSKLGFNADIFLGRFEDNKYVADLTEKYAKQADPVAALNKARNEAIRQVTAFCQKEGIDDPKHAVGLITAAVKHELGKDKVESVEEMDRVVQTILAGKYALDSGEPVAA